MIRCGLPSRTVSAAFKSIQQPWPIQRSVLLLQGHCWHVKIWDIVPARLKVIVSHRQPQCH